MHRREFIAYGATAAAALSGSSVSAIGQATRPATQPREVTGGPRVDQAMINEFVGAGHGNLERVKQMLADEPPAQKRLGGLIMAERELLLGDFETALGGASHMGNREIALFLLSKGARIDAFAAAMLGYRDVVRALLQANPQTAITKGPHAISLMYHAAISGDLDMAGDIKAHLPANSPDFNKALTSAARAGKIEMVRWLLDNGATDVNAKDGANNTALKYATQNNFPEIAATLRNRGAQ